MTPRKTTTKRPPPRKARPGAKGTRTRPKPGAKKSAAKTTATRLAAREAKNAAKPRAITPANVESQLLSIEAGEGDGVLDLGRGATLRVTSLGKQFFPEAGLTKGGLMRYYARVSRLLLPHIEGRPLVLQRYPSGVDGEMFFQQDAGDHVPEGVRVAAVQTVDKGPQDRFIGGDLLTLLYTVQLGTIEVHPWLSRIEEIEHADRCLIDLDPGDGVPFAHVVELAHDILRITRKCGLLAAVKTSGSSGIHLVFPLPARTTFATSAELAMLVARAAVIARPELATVERAIRARPDKSIYVDAMQNAHGKSMASAYSVRARPTASVSTPLRERELTARLKIGAFTVRTMPERLDRVGELWGAALTRRPAARELARTMQAIEEILDAAKPPRKRRG